MINNKLRLHQKSFNHMKMRILRPNRRGSSKTTNLAISKGKSRKKLIGICKKECHINQDLVVHSLILVSGNHLHNLQLKKWTSHLEDSVIMKKESIGWNSPNNQIKDKNLGQTKIDNSWNKVLNSPRSKLKNQKPVRITLSICETSIENAYFEFSLIWLFDIIHHNSQLCKIPIRY